MYESYRERLHVHQIQKVHNGLIKIEKFKHATNFIIERSVFSITYRATTVKRLPKENKKIVLNETNDRFKTNSVLTISALTNYRSRCQLERLFTLANLHHQLS